MTLIFTENSCTIEINMKKIIFAVFALALAISSCTVEVFPYKISYRIPGSVPSFSRVTNYYVTRNLLTPEEEVCLLEKVKTNCLQIHPTATDFQIELDPHDGFSGGERFTCE